MKTPGLIVLIGTNAHQMFVSKLMAHLKKEKSFFTVWAIVHSVFALQLNGNSGKGEVANVFFVYYVFRSKKF